MIEKYSIRTDLALEQKERFEADNVEISGVVLEEKYDEERDIKVTTVRIETENGARTMGKPVGTYITLEAPELAVPDEGYHREVSEEILRFLRRLLDMGKEDYSVLVVGLGNRQVTPDALGPYVADNLNITRHIVKEYGKYAMGKDQVRLLSAIVPGVMGQTGMETVEIIRGVVRETKPDAVIAIDALAARNSRRLNRTVQISDTGISPGSGIGNQRSAITEETVGVNLIAQMERSETMKGVGVVLQGYNAAEKYELVKELIAPHLNGMFVTPKDVDETVKRISFTISEALNRLFA